MKTIFLSLMFILLLSILSLAFSTSIVSGKHKNTFNNQSLAVNELLTVYQKDNFIRGKELTHKETSFPKAKKDIFSNDNGTYNLETQQVATIYNQSLKYTNMRRFKRQTNFAEKVGKILGISEKNTKISLYKPTCSRLPEMFRKLDWFSFTYNTEKQLIGITNPIVSSNHIIYCDLSKYHPQDRNSVIIITEKIFKIKQRLLEYKQDIFCRRKNMASKCFYKLNKQNFFMNYDIYSLHTLIINSNILFNCNLNLFKFINVLISAHFDLMKKCYFIGKKTETVNIASKLIEAMQILYNRNYLIITHNPGFLLDCNNITQNNYCITQTNLIKSNENLKVVISELQNLLLNYQNANNNTVNKSEKTFFVLFICLILQYFMRFATIN